MHINEAANADAHIANYVIQKAEKLEKYLGSNHHFSVFLNTIIAIFGQNVNGAVGYAVMCICVSMVNFAVGLHKQ